MIFIKEIIDNDWGYLLDGEGDKEYYQKLRSFLIKEYKTRTVYPDMYDIFNPLRYTPYKEVKAVILGQDPYHGPGQAHGLAFSVKPGVKTPPSLRNIYKELKEDLGCYIPNNGYLKKWADEGVLLLNTAFTVRAREPNSHRNIGWEKFSDHIIKLLSAREEPVIFILWGNNARAKRKIIDTDKHYIIESVHPSPLAASRGFFGSKPFSKTNKILQELGREAIDWQIEDI